MLKPGYWVVTFLGLIRGKIDLRSGIAKLQSDSVALHHRIAALHRGIVGLHRDKVSVKWLIRCFIWETVNRLRLI